MVPQTYTMQEVAEKFGVSLPTIYRWAQTKDDYGEPILRTRKGYRQGRFRTVVTEHDLEVCKEKVGVLA